MKRSPRHARTQGSLAAKGPASSARLLSDDLRQRIGMPAGGNCLLHSPPPFGIGAASSARPAYPGCGSSSGVEHNLAKVGVEGSNPFSRSNTFSTEAVDFPRLFVFSGRGSRWGGDAAGYLRVTETIEDGPASARWRHTGAMLPRFFGPDAVGSRHPFSSSGDGGHHGK